MNVFAKFDEIPTMVLQDIKETKRHGHTFVRSFVRTDNVKTLYPPTNTVCGGIKTQSTKGTNGKYVHLVNSSFLVCGSPSHRNKIVKWKAQGVPQGNNAVFPKYPQEEETRLN